MTIRPGPIAAVLVLIGLGAWVYFHEYRGGAERRRAEEQRSRAIPFEREDLAAITLANEHGQVRLEKDGETYRIVEPILASTDREAIEGLLAALEVARIKRRVDGAGDLARYDLDPPRATLTVELASSEAPLTLRLGGQAPIGST